MANARLSNSALAVDGFVNVGEALHYLGISSRTTLYEMIKRGDVVAASVRGRRVISRRSMQTFAESRLERTDRHS